MPAGLDADRRLEPDMSELTIPSIAYIAPTSKTGGNPEGKGVSGLLRDWSASEPRGIVAKPGRQVLAEFFTSMLVLSATFKYRPAVGGANYLYWIRGAWSLSLIAPEEWSNERRAAFAGTCVLQHDMTWTMIPSKSLDEKGPVADAVARFYEAFANMLNTDLTLEDVLPSYVERLPYYQRLYASALSRSVRATLAKGNKNAIRCRQWLPQLPQLARLLP